MKKIYLFFICLLINEVNYAQYVTLYTPNGSPIETFITNEFSNEYIVQLTNLYSRLWS